MTSTRSCRVAFRLKLERRLRLCFAARIVCRETLAFQDLQCGKAGYTEHEIGSPLDERQRQCLIGRNSEYAAQQDQARLLSPERARDGKGRAPNSLHEAF